MEETRINKVDVGSVYFSALYGLPSSSHCKILICTNGSLFRLRLLQISGEKHYQSTVGPISLSNAFWAFSLQLPIQNTFFFIFYKLFPSCYSPLNTVSCFIKVVGVFSMGTF